MAGAMCAGSRGKTCYLPMLTADKKVPTLRPCNLKGQKNPHLPPQPLMPESSGTSDPNKRTTTTAPWGGNTTP
ncbi:Hypothetical predicted protein [Pelobates cultripes]|uniref:Uncharacterized protein n=1 Tax=Pelobates cultripes TaxID=61616 RepID=A0AAD1R3E3_PELCU|nr:Hypothetical predicted protein [Pelobates cultripes]